MWTVFDGIFTRCYINIILCEFYTNIAGELHVWTMFEGILLNIVSILHYVHFHANIAGELPRLDRVPPYGGGP